MSKADIELIATVNKADYCTYLDIMVELIIAMEDWEQITIY